MPSYGKVCDTFFLYTESEKISQHNEKKTNAVLSKRERFERDHARRISGLEREQELNYAKGEMIILNADRIDEAIGLINGALASGIQWDALKALLKRRHAEGHPVAYMIHELSLEKNAMSVLLERELYDDEDDGDVESMVVEVSLSKTAHANATDYFSKKKANQQKLEKTKAATGKAAAGATRKGERVAATQQTKKKIVVERQREWWEKFYWFITSAGDVVFQGRDTQTTEILIRRMMRVGDIVVMCDVEGALPCLLRPMHALWSGNGGGDNDAKLLSDGRQPVSRLSLEEAGAWCVSLSAAWEQKQSIGSWWVFGSQITGGTATGCYLFDGEKNHISPQPLTLGCALLCRVKRSVISGEDRPAAPGEDEEEEEMTAPPPEVNPSAPLPWANVLHDLHELKDGKDYVMPDTAHSLKELPSVESLRVRRPAQTHHHHHQQQQGKHADPKSQLDSNMDEKSDITTATTAATTQQQQHLTKHQKKKLKKIRDRYGDQDDEDRALGMALNGNKLASVQQAELQRVAAEAEQRRALEKEAEKQRRAELREKGKLRYRSLDDAGSQQGTDDDDDDEDAEVVSEFTDDGNVSDHNNAACPGSSQPGDDEPPACDDDKVDDDHQGETPSPAPAGAPSSSSHPATNLASAPYAAAQDEILKKVLPYFTCRPLPTDTVEHIICVCAPYHVLIPYTYRVELSFGNIKKGHAARALLQAFQERAAHAGGGGATGSTRHSKKDMRRREAAAAEAKHSNMADTDASATAAAAAVNPSLVQVLESMDIGECMEQLRGNIKPLNIRMK